MVRLFIISSAMVLSVGLCVVLLDMHASHFLPATALVLAATALYNHQTLCVRRIVLPGPPVRV